MDIPPVTNSLLTSTQKTSLTKDKDHVIIKIEKLKKQTLIKKDEEYKSLCSSANTLLKNYKSCFTDYFVEHYANPPFFKPKIVHLYQLINLKESIIKTRERIIKEVKEIDTNQNYSNNIEIEIQLPFQKNSLKMLDKDWAETIKDTKRIALVASACVLGVIGWCASKRFRG